jgi:signal transduction histidine kinase
MALAHASESAAERSRAEQQRDALLVGERSARAEAENALRKLRAAHERLELLSRRLVQLQETERAEISRELHDEVGQLLTGLGLMVGASDLAPVHRAAIESVVADLIGRVRDLSMTLRPPMLDTLGLAPALLWQIERFERQSGIRVAFRQAGLERRFPAPVEMTAFRIVQEALTNAARHAGVDSLTVQVVAGHEHLRVSIEDQGRGFDVEAALARPSAGLAGLYERCRLLGAQLRVESTAGRGTLVEATLPLATPPGEGPGH